MQNGGSHSVGLLPDLNVMRIAEDWNTDDRRDLNWDVISLSAGPNAAIQLQEYEISRVAECMTVRLRVPRPNQRLNVRWIVRGLVYN